MALARRFTAEVTITEKKSDVALSIEQFRELEKDLEQEKDAKLKPVGLKCLMGREVPELKELLTHLNAKFFSDEIQQRYVALHTKRRDLYPILVKHPQLAREFLNKALNGQTSLLENGRLGVFVRPENDNTTTKLSDGTQIPGERQSTSASASEENEYTFGGRADVLVQLLALADEVSSASSSNFGMQRGGLSNRSIFSGRDPVREWGSVRVEGSITRRNS